MSIIVEKIDSAVEKWKDTVGIDFLRHGAEYRMYNRDNNQYIGQLWLTAEQLTMLSSALLYTPYKLYMEWRKYK